MKGLLLLFMSEDQGKSVPMKVSIRSDSADKWGLFLMRKGNLRALKNLNMEGEKKASGGSVVP
jgi:hypothetical protein